MARLVLNLSDIMEHGFADEKSVNQNSQQIKVKKSVSIRKSEKNQKGMK